MHPDDVVRVAGFDWDAANRDKCERHGVSTTIIEALFRQPLAIVPDPAHSHAETRFNAIGKAKAVAMCLWFLRCGSMPTRS
jgi:uncharacterized DUF497 family protein